MTVLNDFSSGIVDQTTVDNKAFQEGVRNSITGWVYGEDHHANASGKKVTAVGNWDGWQDPGETWTYVSASSFKVSGVDVTAKYPVGTKIKLTQTSAKYFYVTSTSFSTDTTVNVTGGTDYTLANAAITSPYYSYAASPQAFPHWLAWTPTITGSGGTIGTFAIDGGNFKFCIVGRMLHLRGRNRITDVGSWSGDVRFSYPVAPSGLATNNDFHFINVSAQNSGAPFTCKGVGIYSGSADYFLFAIQLPAGSLQWSSIAQYDNFWGETCYKI